jgi:putative membrane protein
MNPSDPCVRRASAMMGMHGMGWAGWLLLSLASIALWALVALAVVGLFRATWGVAGRKGDEDATRTTLDQRFARGEIDAEEYHARFDVLRGRP